MPSVVLGAVSLLPSDPSTEMCRSARNVTAVGCRPALAFGGVPRTQLRQAARVTGPNQQDVAIGDRHPLRPLGCLQIRSKDVLAGLEPGDTPQPRHVEQHPAADDAVLDDLDRVDRSPPRW